MSILLAAAAATAAIVPAGTEAAVVSAHPVSPQVVTPQISSAPAAPAAPTPSHSSPAPASPTPLYGSYESEPPPPLGGSTTRRPSPPVRYDDDGVAERAAKRRSMSQAERDQLNAEFKDWFFKEDAISQVYAAIGALFGGFGDDRVVEVPESFTTLYSGRQLATIASGLGGRYIVVSRTRPAGEGQNGQQSNTPGDANPSAPADAGPSNPGGQVTGAGGGSGDSQSGGDLPTEIEDPGKAEK